jgi:hypothetical protein
MGDRLRRRAPVSGAGLAVKSLAGQSKSAPQDTFEGNAPARSAACSNSESWLTMLVRNAVSDQAAALGDGDR